MLSSCLVLGFPDKAPLPWRRRGYSGLCQARKAWKPAKVHPTLSLFFATLQEEPHPDGCAVVVVMITTIIPPNPENAAAPHCGKPGTFSMTKQDYVL